MVSVHGEQAGKRHSRLRRDWRNHRMDAARREIPFLLSFEEWLTIWQDSGHIEERGCHKGQYVMARYGDLGPYEIGNVRIVRVEENHAEAWARVEQKRNHKSRMMGNTRAAGTIRSVEHRDAVRRAQQGNTHRKGKVLSAEHRAKIGAGLRGNTNTLGHTLSRETRAKMSASRKGKRPSPKTRRKLSEAKTKYWETTRKGNSNGNG